MHILDVDLAERADEPAAKSGSDIQLQKCFIVLESSRPDSRLDHGRRPLVEQLVET
jgi:hypothetical protein